MKTINAAFFIILHLLAGSVFAQTPQTILREAMAKAGPWETVSTLRYHTRGESFNKWQTYDYFKPTASANEAIREFDLKEGRYYFKTTTLYGGGYEFIFANIGKDTTRYLYDVNRSRNGITIAKGGKAAFDNGLLTLNQNFPYFLLKTVADGKDSLSLVKDAASGVRRHARSGVEDYFFGDDGQLKKMVTIQNGQTIERVFSGYVNEGGLMYPKEVRVYVDKELLTNERLLQLERNKPFDEALLVIPPGYTPAPAGPPAAMKVSEIAKDVFLVENVTGGRNIMFVNMDSAVFVTEAPLNSETSQSLIDLIHKTVPGKPVRYVHLSHFHNDHSNGIRAFVADGATLISTAPTIAALEGLVNDTSARFKDRLSRQRVPLRSESFSGVKVLKDAHHEIELHELHNTHARGMSFVYLPKEKIIYQGDLYTVPDDGTITPAIAITRDFRAYLKKRKMKPVRIIGHHGRPDITMELLEKAVSMKK